MSDCNGSSQNGELYSGNVHEEDSEQEFTKERDISPGVVHSVLGKTEEPSPADKVVRDLEEDSTYKVG